MGNHVLYDALWESERLAKCSLRAALAYPWIFLVADDHGRFEYKPRMVWKHAFSYREDVTVEDVAGWLDEYWRAGLLTRYHIDGELAHWYKFRGRKPSDRKPSDYPDPKGMPVFTADTATPPPRRGDDTATPPRETRARDRSDQIGSEESRKEHDPPTYLHPPDVRAEKAIREATWMTERKLLRAVALLAEKLGRDPPDVMREVTAYRKPDGTVVKGRVNPADLSTERVEKSLEDAEAWLADLEKKAASG